MRLTPLRLAFLFCAALFLLGPAAALTQQPGGRGKGKGGGGDNTQPGGDTGGRTRGGNNTQPGDTGGRTRGGDPSGNGGGGRGGFDPSRIFDLIAGGKDTIDINSMPTQFDPNARQKALDWAQKNNITNGQLTREQFSQYMQEAMAQRGGGGGRGQGGPGGNGGRGQPRDYDKEAEDSFRRYDKEGDGKLTVDDMPSALRNEWEKWDANQDGAIDLTEYKEYYKARMAFLNPGQDGTAERDPRNRDNRNNQDIDPTQEEEKRPTVYRVGHMPRELPPWFEQLDTDRDGQVGLYEWKRGGRDINEFMKIDVNGDGFLTVEEVLRWQKVEVAKKKQREQTTTVALGSEDEDGVPTQLPRTISAPGSYSGRGSRGPAGNYTPRGGNGGDPSANPWAPKPSGETPGSGAPGGKGRGNRGGGSGAPDAGSGRGNRGGGR